MLRAHSGDMVLLSPSPLAPTQTPLGTQTEWRPVPRSGDPSHGACALAALRCALRLAGLSPAQQASAYLQVLSCLAEVVRLDMLAAVDRMAMPDKVRPRCCC